MPAWIDEWQETLRVQRKAIRQTARKKALPHWNTAGIFQDTVRVHRNRASSGEAKLSSGVGRQTQTGAAGAALKSSQPGKAACHGPWEQEDEDDEDEDNEDEDDDESDAFGSRGRFARKLESHIRNIPSEAAVVKRSRPAKPTLVVAPLESTPDAALRMASSIREELVGLCRQVGLVPTAQQEESLIPVQEISHPTPASASDSFRHRKRADLASQLRDQTLSRARRELKSKRSASIQTASVYDVGQRIDQEHVIKACGLGAEMLGEDGRVHGDLRETACRLEEAKIEGTSWGEIVVHARQDHVQIQIQSTSGADGRVNAVPTETHWTTHRDVTLTQGDGVAVENAVSNQKQAEITEVHMELSAEQRWRHAPAPMLPFQACKQHLPARFGVATRADDKPGIVPIRRQNAGHGSGLYDVSVIQALRRKAVRRAGCEPQENSVVQEAQGTQSKMVDTADLQSVGATTSSRLLCQPDDDLGMERARTSEPKVGPPEGGPNIQREDFDGSIPDGSPATTEWPVPTWNQELATDEIASSCKEDVQEQCLSPAGDARSEPEGLASDSDAWVASPASRASCTEELPPLPPYRPLPSLHHRQEPKTEMAEDLGRAAPKTLAAKELEERFYGSLQILDSVQEHLSVVDLLASQRALQEEQRHALATGRSLMLEGGVVWGWLGVVRCCQDTQ